MNTPISSIRCLLSLALALLSACSQTYHPVLTPPDSPLAKYSSTKPSPASVWANFLEQLLVPGPIEFEKHVAADWEIPLSGLLNLEHPKAQAADLQDKPEPIQIYFYILEHPRFGGFMIDSGVAHSVAQQQDTMPIRWPVSGAMPMDSLHVRQDTRGFLATRTVPLAGVWLTHLHLDHILGLQDVPKQTPLFIGTGETNDSRLTHIATRRSTDANLEGFGALWQWPLKHEDNAPFDFVDVFGDQSVLGLHVPGHTRGNMAFIIRTTAGPQLLTGDACHTAWGWEHGVEPGTFNTDGSQAADSLHRLKQLSALYPKMLVHLGHQPIALQPW